MCGIHLSEFIRSNESTVIRTHFTVLAVSRVARGNRTPPIFSSRQAVRHGLVANVCATHATGTAERAAAALLLEASAPPGSTVGADKGYDVASFVGDVRVLEVTPHVAQKARWSAIDGRTTRHAGYHVSQRKRKLVEQVFGWMKTVGGLRKLRHRGVELVDWQLTFAATAYNMVRLRNLEATCP